jgi:hypothetical protein
VDLAKLVVRLEAQSAQLLTELEKANKKIDRFASQTQKTLNKWAGNLLGVFSAKAIVNFGQEVLKAQGDLVAMAEVANTSVENLSGLGYAAEQSASSLDSLNKGLGGLADRAAAAADSTSKTETAFDKLGIAVLDQNGKLKDSADLLLEVADKFAQYEDGAGKSAVATDLFGKVGKELIPLLNRGSAGIEELTKKAAELGIVVSTEAAQAANNFNDQLATLGSITKGVVGQALSEVTPIMSGFADGLIDTAGASERLDSAARILAAGLKLLLSAGVIVGEVFDQLGDAVGALAAAVVAAAQGEFGRAFDILNDQAGRTVESALQAGNDLAAIWGDTGKKIEATAKATDEQLKKTLSFGGNKDGLEEINITLEKIKPTAMEDFYTELDQLTSTTTEKAVAAYAEQKAALDALFEDGKIQADAYNLRLEAINKTLADGTGITERQEEAAARLKKTQDEAKSIYEATRTPLEKYNAELVKLNNLLFQGAIDQDTYNRAVEQSQAAYDKATDGAAAFYQEAKENAQDILGQGIYDTLKDGFDRGAGAALDTFADMLARMATEAIAADIMGYLFGSQNKDGSSSGGLIQAGLALFAGGRASEGAVNPGVAYDVGENGPERFVPNTAGRIEDQRRWGGSRNNIYVTVEAPKGTVSRQTQLQTGATIAKQIGQANRRNN